MRQVERTSTDGALDAWADTFGDVYRRSGDGMESGRAVGLARVQAESADCVNDCLRKNKDGRSVRRMGYDRDQLGGGDAVRHCGEGREMQSDGLVMFYDLSQ